MSPGARPWRRTAALAAAAVLLAGCGYSATPVPKAGESTDAGSSAGGCTTSAQDLRSYAPSRAGGPAVDAIRKRRKLRVGVSWDTYLMGSRKAQNNSIVGFDIDLARAIARGLGVRAELHVISAADRVRLLEDGDLDVVVRAFTITCDRWRQIAFSGEYYHATQQVLLRKDLAQTYRGPADLAGKRVCAPAKTTSLANIRKVQPKAIPVTADSHTGCLMKLQQGDADAITGDDTVLAGLAAQDPYAKVPAGQAPLEAEPYGVGMNAKDKDLVAYVNAILQQYEKDGSWEASYRKWLQPVLGPASPPTMLFGRS